MIQVVIVEDERPSAERLAIQISKLNPPINVVAKLGSVAETRSWFRDNSPPDILFMDIQLGDGTAFDFLTEVDLTTPIIFTTAYDEYAVKAFEYNSIDYLLKPIDLEKLQTAVGKLLKVNRMAREDVPVPGFESIRRVVTGDFKKRFLVKVGDQFVPIDTNEIRYFFYDKGSSAIMTGESKKYILDHSLDQIENLINPLDFYRINRQFILSVQSIGEIHSYFNSRLLIRLRPSWEEDVIVSRDRVTDFKRWMDL